MFSLNNTFNKQNNETHGRKKFGVYNRISNELRRAIRESNNWTYNTPSDLLKLFEYDGNRKFMPVRGNSIIKFSYTLNDVISLLRTFTIEIKASKHASKLAQSPIFSKPDKLCVAEKELGYIDEFPYFSERNTHDSAICNSNAVLSEFSSTQHYNVDGAFHYSIADTFLCCIYELLKLLTTTSYDNLESKICEHFKHPRFKRLDSYGFYMFLLHLRTRGIAKITWFKELQAWRSGWKYYTHCEKQKILNDFYAGSGSKAFNAMQEMLIAEQEWFHSILTHEAKLIRYPSKIGRKLFNPRLIYYATWRYAIFDQMTPVEKYRDMSGMPLKHLSGEPTMFKVKESITEAVDESIPKVKDALKESLTDLLKSPEIKCSLQNIVTESLEPTLKNFEMSSEKVSVTVIENMKTAMSPFIDQAFSLFSTVNGLVDFMKSMLQQALDAFPKELFGHKIDVQITPDTLINILKYYIVYVNCNSQTLKIALIYLMLKELGLLTYIMQWGATLFNLAFGNAEEQKDVLTGDEIEGEPTSGMDWISNLADMIFSHKNEISLCTMFTALLVLIFKHTLGLRGAGTMRFNEYSTIAGMVIGMCKGFHWVGSGLFGLDRIYKYFMIISKSLTTYIQKYIMGISI